MDTDALRRRYTDLLLDRVEETRFPSVDYMNRIEASLTTGEQVERYVELLLEKVEEPRYPSLPLLDRLQRVLDRLAALETARSGSDENENGRG